MKKISNIACILFSISLSQESLSFENIGKGEDILKWCQNLESNMEKYKKFENMQTLTQRDLREAITISSNSSSCVGVFLGVISSYKSIFLEGYAYPYSIKEIQSFDKEKQKEILQSKIINEGEEPSKDDLRGFCGQDGRSTIAEIIKTVTNHISENEYLQQKSTGEALISALKSEFPCPK